MSNEFKTDQEEFWAGDFGNSYSDRNRGEQQLASNIHYWSEILKNAYHVQTVLEFGANIGLNIKAIKQLLPSAKLSAVEINQAAYNELVSITDLEGFCQSIFDFETSRTFNFTFVKGVLIHIAPEMLGVAYDKLYYSSNKYVCIGEYYNPTPVEIPYRGHSNKLFKRDFGGEFLARFPLVKLVKYGFSYRHDPVFPQDDITWWLFEKVEVKKTD